MTKKFFIEAARIISLIENPAEKIRTAERFAEVFARENARFDHTRFLEACVGKKAIVLK